MSASQEKKLRKELRAEGKDKRQIAKKEAEKSIKRRRITETTVTIIVAVLILAVVVFSSGLLNTTLTAVKIGDTSYTAAEYSFFYKTSYNNYVNQYGSYLSMLGLDTTKSLSSQKYSEEQTWEDYFKEMAQKTMQEISAFYDEAQKADFKLSEEDQASLDTSIESLKTSHQGSDYSSADAYLAAAYGKGCNEKIIGSLIEKYYIAQAYSKQMNDSFTYTDDDLKAYYTENKDTLDKFTYIAYLVDGSVPETSADAAASASPDAAVASPSASPDTTALKEAAMANAKKLADSIVAAGTTTDKFIKAVKDETSAVASKATTSGKDLTEAYADWLKDASRAEGDTTVIETETGYYALYFISRDDNSYKTISVRHILIKAVADDTGAYTDEAKAAAKTKAEDLLKQWKGAEATEDSFAALATASSEDAGSNTNGGLYENVFKGQMVTEFNDWCFAAGRKTGDTGIVYGENSEYSGYHVVYFVGAGDKAYADTLAETSKREKDYSDWKTALLAKYEISTGIAASLVR